MGWCFEPSFASKVCKLRRMLGANIVLHRLAQIINIGFTVTLGTPLTGTSKVSFHTVLYRFLWVRFIATEIVHV